MLEIRIHCQPKSTILWIWRRLPGIDDDRHALAAADPASLSPRAEAQFNDRGSGWCGIDLSGAPGADYAILAQAGFDVRLFTLKVEDIPTESPCIMIQTGIRIP